MSTVWVKVIDRLPPMDTVFDIWHKTRGRITDHGPYRRTWDSDTIKSALLLQGITHWSLPTPPDNAEVYSKEPYSVITLTPVPEGIKKEFVDIDAACSLFSYMVEMKPEETIREESFDCAFWSTETHYDPNSNIDVNRRPVWATKVLFMHKRDIQYA